MANKKTIKPANSVKTCLKFYSDNFDIAKRQSINNFGKLIALFSFSNLITSTIAKSATTINSKSPAQALVKTPPAKQVLSIRLWSAPDYSRITIESSENLKYIINQDLHNKLIIEIANVQINDSQLAFEKKLLWLDTYIENISIAQNGVNGQLIIEFKELVKSQIFENKPISIYQYRLFIDVYPQKEADPITSLLEANAKVDKLEALSLTINAKEAQGKDDKQLREMLVSLDNKLKSKDIDTLDNLDEFINGQVKITPSSGKTQTTKAENQSKNAMVNAHKDNPVTAPTIKKTTRRLIVVLDPGHGGEDPGAIGVAKSYEKNIVLAISKLAVGELEKFGFATVLTRDQDFFIPLHKRVLKAQKINADLFISVHADAFIKPTARGSSTFILSDKGASSSAAKWLAQKENAADAVGGVLYNGEKDVAQTLKDLVQTRTQTLSKLLSQNILKELGKINILHKSEVENAGFAVLKAPDIPSTLIETAFISNPQEEKRLNNRDYQQALAMAIARGVFRYFGSL